MSDWGEQKALTFTWRRPMETMRDYQAVHLLAEKGKLAQYPTFREELSRSVMVQCGEQRPLPGWHVGVIVYLRQDGRTIPEQLNPILYIACVQQAVDNIIGQAVEVCSRPRGEGDHHGPDV